MEDYTKCELIGVVSPRQLNTFSNFLNFLLLLYTIHKSIHLVAILVGATTAASLHRRPLQQIFW